jgi:hypothetical protein
MTILGGQAATVEPTTSQLLTNFALGALAGYGAKDVFVWLDDKVEKLFQVVKTTPDVQGQQEALAVSRLQAQNLTVGAVAAVPVDVTTTPEGIVLDQAPTPGTPIARGETVDLTVAVEPSPTNGTAQPKSATGNPAETAPAAS